MTMPLTVLPHAYLTDASYPAYASHSAIDASHPGWRQQRPAERSTRVTGIYGEPQLLGQHEYDYK